MATTKREAAKKAATATKAVAKKEAAVKSAAPKKEVMRKKVEDNQPETFILGCDIEGKPHYVGVVPTMFGVEYTHRKDREGAIVFKDEDDMQAFVDSHPENEYYIVD